jgi:hypothetical protein
MSLHRVATHEAGHAVAATVLRLPVRFATVFADGRGSVTYFPVPISAANIARRAVESTNNLCQTFRSSSGSLAMLAAMRRASSRGE